MALIMTGEEVAAGIDAQTRARASKLKARGIDPVLAIVRAGARDADAAYERGASARCRQVGVSVKKVALPENVDQHAIEATVAALSDDANVHGVLLLSPLPAHLAQREVKERIDLAKDVDGVTGASFAMVYAGYGEGFAPCTAEACMRMLEHYGVELAGKRAAIIGNSLVVGRPAAMMLMAADATPTICHARTTDVPAIARRADIVIVAAGLTQAVGAEYFRAGQVVIDVGIGSAAGGRGLRGDVIMEEVEPLADAITPVPGGVGVVTSSVLAIHVVQAAEKLSAPMR